MASKKDGDGDELQEATDDSKSIQSFFIQMSQGGIGDPNMPFPLLVTQERRKSMLGAILNRYNKNQSKEQEDELKD